MAKKQDKTEVVIIGAGPGGYAAAFHAADRRFQHGPTGVTELLARFEMRLLTDDAFALDFLHLVVGIGDDPVAGQELCRHRSLVPDGNGIGEYVAVLLR